MNYIQKILVLKEVGVGFSVSKVGASGICKITIDQTATLNLSLINLATLTGGNYEFYLIDGNGQLFKFFIGQTLPKNAFHFETTPDLEKGLAGALFFRENERITPVLFNTLNLPININDIRNKICDSESTQPYDDFAVATENYYLNENEQTELYQQNEHAEDCCEEQKENREEPIDLCQNETVCLPCQEFGIKERYYDGIKKELDEIFSNAEKETALEKVLPNSKFCKVKYSGDKYYTVGVIYENNKPIYLCYGVPSKYSRTPPKELQGYCSFIPLSVFDLNGDGYFLMYQNAETGECIKFN